MDKNPVITVVGSINMDLVTLTDKVPQMGETLMGTKFQTNPGGKGANQAVAAARLGVHVKMIGCVGKDQFGTELLQHLQNQGVDTAHVETVEDRTGIATIIVSGQDNSIIVVPGANDHVTGDFVESRRDIIAQSDLLLLQLEIPLEAVQKAVQIAKENGVKVILNPAPIRDLPGELLGNIEYLTPNEHEYKLLPSHNEEFHKKVILTKGREGVSCYEGNQLVNIPAFNVSAIDTTGAGDSFNGGFAVGLSKGLSLKEACQYGNAVAALSTTRLGAQTGMPTANEVEAFLNSQK
ncbi:ribokinase [Mesobacillus foraminis]|uniref:ribokinase n=1 Tax=Mesobacillus foraminis TaxID=279826 RepID=UPI000EF4B31D|nr:ribokinase [Mesobacillus foraminis]